MAEGDGAVGGGPERRLGVLPGAGAGRGVARVPDRDVALERVERRLVEDLRDQAHVLVDQDLPPVADRDAGRLLAAVLQGVEPEVGQLGDFLAGGPDAEDAAGVLRALVVGVEAVVRRPSPPFRLLIGWGTPRVYGAKAPERRTERRTPVTIRRRGPSGRGGRRGARQPCRRPGRVRRRAGREVRVQAGSEGSAPSGPAYIGVIARSTASSSPIGGVPWLGLPRVVGAADHVVAQ